MPPSPGEGLKLQEEERMSSYEVKRIDEMEAVYMGAFKRARAELGVESFGMQIIDLPPNFENYPEHDHAGDGQEEVFVAMRGGAEIEIAEQSAFDGFGETGGIPEGEGDVCNRGAIGHGRAFRRRSGAFSFRLHVAKAALTQADAWRTGRGETSCRR